MRPHATLWLLHPLRSQCSSAPAPMPPMSPIPLHWHASANLLLWVGWWGETPVGTSLRAILCCTQSSQTNKPKQKSQLVTLHRRQSYPGHWFNSHILLLCVSFQLQKNPSPARCAGTRFACVYLHEELLNHCVLFWRVALGELT
jgi:hypothetical protein